VRQTQQVVTDRPVHHQLPIIIEQHAAPAAHPQGTSDRPSMVNKAQTHGAGEPGEASTIHNVTRRAHDADCKLSEHG
jgi:hypothetical protein